MEHILAAFGAPANSDAWFVSVAVHRVVVMTVYVTAITPRNAAEHHHITGIRWLNSGDSTSKTMSKQQAVDWVRKGNQLFVAGDTGAVAVIVVEAEPPYLRTAADGSYTNNLLGLPTY
jgi:hypothetical protein